MFDFKDTYVFVILSGNILILLLVAACFMKKPYINISAFLIVIIPFLWLGLREKVVALDAVKYANLFVHLDLRNFWDNGIHDYGYIFFNYILRFLTDKYEIFFIAISIVQVICIFIFYKQFKNHIEYLWFLAFAMYISTFSFWKGQLTMFRQGIAIPMFSLAIYKFIFERNLKVALLWASLGGAFHFSAFFLFILSIILFYVFNYVWRFRRIAILGILFMLFISSPVFANIMKIPLYYLSDYNVVFKKMLWYFNWPKLTTWNIKHVYYLILLLLLAWWTVYYRKSELDFFIKRLFIISLIMLSMLVILKHDEMVADRIFMYFVPFLPIYVTTLFFELSNIIKAKYLKLNKPIIIMLISIGILVWFNIKFILLQYPGWFIYPYPSVR